MTSFEKTLCFAPTFFTSMNLQKKITKLSIPLAYWPSRGLSFFFNQRSTLVWLFHLAFAFLRWLPQVNCFPSKYHRSIVFLRLAVGTGYVFSLLGKGYVFSRAWQRSHVYPRLAHVTSFPALGTGYVVSRAWDRLHVLPRLALVYPRLGQFTCFPALGTGSTLLGFDFWLVLTVLCINYSD